MIEKCKKHHKPIIECKYNHYEEMCDCFPRCSVCLKVSAKERERLEKKSNYVIEIFNGLWGAVSPTKILQMKFKPRHKLNKGTYAVLDTKTGYLVKANGPFVQFYVVK